MTSAERDATRPVSPSQWNRRRFLLAVAEQVPGAESDGTWLLMGERKDAVLRVLPGFRGRPEVKVNLTAQGSRSEAVQAAVSRLRSNIVTITADVDMSLTWDVQGSSFSCRYERVTDGPSALAWTVDVVDRLRRHILEPLDAPARTQETQLPVSEPELTSAETDQDGTATTLRNRDDYRRKVEALESAPGGGGERRREVRVQRHVRSVEVRALVLTRSEGGCENPDCTSPGFQAVTDQGDPIVEVDHVDDLAGGGEDHPANMVALCPNCHAVKTRGIRREELRERLRAVARARHAEAMAGGLGTTRDSR
ncbi:HNH endonuclease signature motif containing protein [Streptomyces zaomyceticus]|uniref:HNH endonuclease signature motif containing protein n=1 Tax=Streptomyces zaomyceticus TaxID=68286 RepID=UPI003438D088